MLFTSKNEFLLNQQQEKRNKQNVGGKNQQKHENSHGKDNTGEEKLNETQSEWDEESGENFTLILIRYKII